MSKGNTFENDLLKLILQNVAIAGVADALAVAGSLYFALHTADPGEAGDQTTSECAYTSYARVAVARSALGFSVAGNVGGVVNPVVFPTGTGGGGVPATNWSLGTALSGAGKILYKGALGTPIMTGIGVPPRIDTVSITED